jgi:hypothetical protein
VAMPDMRMRVMGFPLGTSSSELSPTFPLNGLSLAGEIICSCLMLTWRNLVNLWPVVLGSVLLALVIRLMS